MDANKIISKIDKSFLEKKFEKMEYSFKRYEIRKMDINIPNIAYKSFRILNLVFLF